MTLGFFATGSLERQRRTSDGGERGKLAGMVVLNQNLLKIPSSRISDTKVLRTIVGGRTVYTAAR